MRTNIVLVEEKEGLWFSGSLDFLGVTSRGDTKNEARKNIELILGDMAMHKEISLNLENKDSDEYIKDIYSSKQKYILSDVKIEDHLFIEEACKSVRTNVSIKKGYKVLAKLRKINISDFLNKSLSKELDTEF